MNGIHAHQGNLADTVADACIADLGPEPLIACRVGRIQADMAEAGDSGVTAGEIAPPAALGADPALDMIAGRVAEAYEGLHLALLGLLRGAGMDGMAER